MPFRVAFFGTPAFAVPTLEHLLRSRHKVVGVVTQPDRPRGRGQQVSPWPVKAVAQAAGLPVLQPARLERDVFERDFASLGADIGVVAAYGKILPDWLLAAPRRGLINVHASLLPKYRGASPIHHAIMAGEAETGVTIVRVVQALDSGAMLAATAIPIGPQDTTASLEPVLAEAGAALLVHTLDALSAGAVDEVQQDESQATYAPRLTKADGRVDWSRSALQIHNQVRGLSPWPHADALLKGARYIVHRSAISARTSDAPAGTIVAASAADGLLVACGDHVCLEIVDLQPEGRRVMTARDLLANPAVSAGARFSAE